MNNEEEIRDRLLQQEAEELKIPIEHKTVPFIIKLACVLVSIIAIVYIAVIGESTLVPLFIGELDKNGYLTITGRIKNMIVLGGGKKIFPEEVEAVLEHSDKIKELCVLALKIKSGN